MVQAFLTSFRSLPLSTLCLSVALLSVTACDEGDDNGGPGQAGGGVGGSGGAGRAGAAGKGGSGGSGGVGGDGGANGSGGSGAGGGGGANGSGAGGSGTGGGGGGANGSGGSSAGGGGGGANGSGGSSAGGGGGGANGSGGSSAGGGGGSQTLCGDGTMSPGETCDDANASSGDGCSSKCAIESGYVCPLVGVPCLAAQCGDSLVVGNERCDDGNAADGDGCSGVCQPEFGFACDAPGEPCRPTLCGDGTVEGTETCDDSNNDMGDGCTPGCAVEPSCPASGGPCASTCGDGIFDSTANVEQCDDGNRRDGDGCSSACTIEPGYQCQVGLGGPPEQLELPLVLRDFKMGWNVGGSPQTPQPGGHPDFENNALSGGLELGVVKAQLGFDGKPEYAKALGGTLTTTGKFSFDQWYRDVPSLNQTVVQTLSLGRLPNGTYRFDDASFFPIDGQGFGNQGLTNNYHFTSEVRHWFTYQGGETLDFRGDDDIWVFINKRLVIDLGGIHGASAGSVTLTGSDGLVTQAGVIGVKVVPLGLVPGHIYELVVWHAERQTIQSNYQVTLPPFAGGASICESICGDGIVSPDEICDDGIVDGGYNHCAPACAGFGPRCGDGLVQAEYDEQCDDGNKNDDDTCNNACRPPAGP